MASCVKGIFCIISIILLCTQQTIAAFTAQELRAANKELLKRLQRCSPLTTQAFTVVCQHPEYGRLPETVTRSELNRQFYVFNEMAQQEPSCLSNLFYALAQQNASDVLDYIFEHHCFGMPQDVVSALINQQLGGREPHTALHLAATKGHYDVAQQLIRLGADVNAKDYYGRTPLHLAAIKGHTRLVDLLLRSGADLNETNEIHETALYLATRWQHIPVMRVLLAHGADVNKATVHDTPLHVAAQFGNDVAAELLIAHKAEFNATDSFHATPLNIAIWEQHDTVAHRLLEAGARLDIADCNGYTPLHQAVRRENCALAQCLIEHNTPRERLDAIHMTPLDWAVQLKRPDLVAILMQHGANPVPQNT